MTRRIRSSRLNRYAEKQSRKQFLLFGLGTVIIIFLLIQFAGPLLGLFGNIVFGIRGEDESATNSSQIEGPLLPPNLNPLPNATSSASIDVTGTSIYSEGRIVLYVNDRETDSMRVNEDSSFKFSNIELRKGENSIKARYTSVDDEESEFSSEHLIVRSSEKPLLEISSPSDGSTFKKADKRISISGKTDPSNSVTVNGFRAVVDSDGNFSYFLELNDGENKIAVEAVNAAGISEKKELTIKYES